METREQLAQKYKPLTVEEIQKGIENRQEPMKAIASFYESQRQAEEEARAKAEQEELANMPEVPLPPEQKYIVDLTKQLEALNKRFEKMAKGE